MKMLSLSDGSQFTEVHGDNKVAYCDIRVATSFDQVPADLGGSYHEHGNLLVMHITSNKPHSGAFPVYYLPWSADQMFRIKLKPSSKHPAKDPTWFFGMLGGGVVQPNIFITAAVQGCSVFVRGDPQSPLVYHVNASSKTPPSGATLASAVDAEFLEAAKFKHRSMKQWTALAQAERPKEGPKVAGIRQPAAQSLAGSAGLRDYMPEMKPTALATLKQDYVNELPAADTVEVMQFGTIFGFREDTDWEFYRQTRTTLSYRIGGEWTDEFRDPVCLKFWPNG